MDTYQTIKTAELDGPALDWAVAQADETPIQIHKPAIGMGFCKYCGLVYNPSSDWTLAAAVIERYITTIHWSTDAKNTGWEATINHNGDVTVAYGRTPLVAAMRCFVLEKLGSEVKIPNVLVKFNPDRWDLEVCYEKP